MKKDNSTRQIIFLGHDRDILEMYCKQYADIVWILHENAFNDDDLFIFKVKMILISDFENKNCILYLNELIDKEKILKCVSYHEIYHDLANSIASFYGADSNIQFSLANTLTRDKKLAREISNSLNPHSIKYYLIKTLADLENILALNPHMQFILKPRVGTASAKIKLISGKSDFKNDYFDGQDFLLEEYIDGKEYSVDTVSHQGIHRIIAVGENDFFDQTYIESAHRFGTENCNLEWARIERYVTKFLSKIKHINGLSHTEVRVNDKGVYLIESQLRGGGGYIENAIEILTGHNAAKIAFQLDESPDFNLNNIKTTYLSDKIVSSEMLKYKINNAELIKWVGLEEALKIAGVHSIFPNKNNTVCKELADGFGRDIAILIVGNNESAIQKTLALVKKTLYPLLKGTYS